VDTWAHGEGRLVLNPIYRTELSDDAGNVTLRFEFPTEWYEFENAGYLEYAPESVTVPRGVLADVQSGSQTDAVRDLIGRFVVIGVPDRYMKERRLADWSP
jgi:hypothetical protein